MKGRQHPALRGAVAVELKGVGAEVRDIIGQLRLQERHGVGPVHAHASQRVQARQRRTAGDRVKLVARAAECTGGQGLQVFEHRTKARRIGR